MIDEETAVALARAFLQVRAGLEGPVSVRAEQDAWIISAIGKGGETISVYVDIEDGAPLFYSESVHDVELRKSGYPSSQRP